MDVVDRFPFLQFRGVEEGGQIGVFAAVPRPCHHCDGGPYDRLGMGTPHGFLDGAATLRDVRAQSMGGVDIVLHVAAPVRQYPAGLQQCFVGAAQCVQWFTVDGTLVDIPGHQIAAELAFAIGQEARRPGRCLGCRLPARRFGPWRQALQGSRRPAGAALRRARPVVLLGRRRGRGFRLRARDGRAEAPQDRRQDGRHGRRLSVGSRGFAYARRARAGWRPGQHRQHQIRGRRAARTRGLNGEMPMLR